MFTLSFRNENVNVRTSACSHFRFKQKCEPLSVLSLVFILYLIVMRNDLHVFAVFCRCRRRQTPDRELVNVLFLSSSPSDLFAQRYAVLVRRLQQLLLVAVDRQLRPALKDHLDLGGHNPAVRVRSTLR